MSEMHVVSIVFFVLGILMAAFCRPLGIGFCKVGKRIWKDNALGVPSRFTDFIYDEKGAARIMLFLGIVFAVQGVVFWLLPGHV
jgi:hypothetical protein